MASHEKKNLQRQDENIVENIQLNIWEALIPVVCLMALLAYNIFGRDGAWLGDYSNQYILLVGAAIAAVVGLFNKTSVATMIAEIWENLKSVLLPICILILVGALAGTWLVSGVIPAMVYYGLQVLSPEIFLPASVVIAAIISIATGSSWTTSATVGIALIGIGRALGIPTGMIAGAVISGAYFGDKMSPLSDTTNLAPAMAGTDLFTHIKYMSFTTVPTIIITLIVFSILSFSIDTSGSANISGLLTTIDATFNITPWLFLVPVGVVVLIILKTKPLIALGAGVLLAVVFALMFQPEVLGMIGSTNIGALFTAITTDVAIVTDNATLNDLFTASGIMGMLLTILLIICAMVFGGVMDGIGALSRITTALLSVAKSTFGLFSSTVLSCIGLNVVASDQYLAIVIPGKMFKQAYEDKGLAPENLSRTLEDSGTVTSVLIPWNTCGAYQAGVLGVGVGEYFVYAIFNWLSPIMTLIFAGFGIKIRELVKK
ncbi:MAG: NhaC family Na+:H+ antiporter [Saprospiraceae bacterium]|jgi:NhaC family Na+:H+ antiporter